LEIEVQGISLVYDVQAVICLKILIILFFLFCI